MTDHAKFYEKQISLTEWFEAIGHPQATALRLEDNDKRERLNVLNQLIELPFDKPAQFSGKDVAERSPAFKTYLKAHGDELCAVRLIPDDPALPKLRMRGESIANGTKWFDAQEVDPARYRVDFVPHAESDWATIFVVSQQGIFGEITKGEHSELTQGFHKAHTPIIFHYDFKNWQLSENDQAVKKHLQEIVAHLHVTDPGMRKKLQSKLYATFVHNYLAGYFETTASAALGIWFIDYNRLLGEELAPVVTTDFKSGEALVRGRAASPGVVTGTVRIVQPEQLSRSLAKNDILVCSMTTPDYVPLMRQAAAIVTDLGGILSHAAIIARELKKPCVTGAKNATSVLTDGQIVTVDANLGTVTAN